MKLVNVTNSHSRLVMNQLENTDAEMVKVYSAGNTTVVYTSALMHDEILIVNKKRNLKSSEIEEIKSHFIKKLTADSYRLDEIKTVEMDGTIEISIPKVNQRNDVAI